MQKVYISSTYKDFKEYRSNLISLFQKQLKGDFELTEIMEHMHDDGHSTNLWEACADAVRQCDIYFIILGNSVGSYPPGESRTYTEMEYETAIQEEKIIYRVQLDPLDESTIDDLEKHKALRKSFEGKPVQFFKNETELTTIFVLSLLKHRKKLVSSNPYKGMVPYEIKDADYFFGRDEDVEDFLKVILTNRDKRVFSVTGNSGIGKSSFMRAGVIPKMLSSTGMKFQDYIPLVFEPKNQPLTNLKYQLSRNVEASKGDLSAADFKGSKLIVLVDQAEQLFTHCRTEAELAEREVFFTALEDLATETDLEIFIFLAYRIDQARALEEVPFMQEYAVSYTLPSFDHKESSSNWEARMREIITAPADKNGVDFEGELVNKLINELEPLDSCLPFLQYSLNKLWDPKIIKDQEITYAEFLTKTDASGLVGMVLKHASAAVSRITDNGRNKEKERILKSMLINLVEVNEDERDIRQTVLKGKLFERLDVYDPTLVHEVFEEMVSGKTRLLLLSTRRVEGEEGVLEPCVMLIHEALVRKWDLLKGWIRERREDLQFEKKLKSDAAEFSQKKGRTYKGKKLRQALKWQKTNQDLGDQSTQHFIKRSIFWTLAWPVGIVAFLLLSYLFKLGVYDRYLQQGIFLEQVVNARPEFLQTYLESGGSLSAPMKLSLRKGSFTELDGSFALPQEVGSYFLSKNLRFLDNVHTLEIHNNSSFKDFSAILGEVKENGGLRNLRNNLALLSLKNLYLLESLEDIDTLKALDSLELFGNQNLRLNKGTHFPKSLSYLMLQNNDGMDQIPEFERESNLKELLIIGNDALNRVEPLLAERLTDLVISGNSRLTAIDEQPHLLSLRLLNINNNDRLTEIPELDGLKSLRKLIISENQKLSFDDLPSLSELDSLEEMELGVSDMERLVRLPGGLTSLVLQGNQGLSILDARSFTPGLKRLVVRNNDNLGTLLIEGVVGRSEKYGERGIRDLIVEGNDRLTYFSWIPQTVETLIVKGNEQLEKLGNMYYHMNLKKVVLKDNPKLETVSTFSKSTVEEMSLDNLPHLPNLEFLEGTESLKRLELGELGEINLDYDGTNQRVLSGLSQLEHLTYHGDYFELDFDVRGEGSAYPALKALTVHGNDFASVFPGVIGIEGLKRLTFTKSKTVRWMPRLRLDSLQYLEVSDNSGLKEWNRQEQLLPLLDTLVVQGNKSLGDLPDFSKYPNIRVLVLSKNQNLQAYEGFEHLRRLEHLRLEDCGFSLEGIGGLEGLFYLRELQLIKNGSLIDIDSIRLAQNLERLVVQNNGALKVVPDLSKSARLKSLSIMENKILREIRSFGRYAAQLDTLRWYDNREVSWNKTELKGIDWGNSPIQYLEIDVRTFEQLFLETGLLEKTDMLGDLSRLKKLVIRMGPEDDLRSLRLTEIQESRRKADEEKSGNPTGGELFRVELKELR